jgi:predicted XRE-type DNA-binding protein
LLSWVGFTLYKFIDKSVFAIFLDPCGYKLARLPINTISAFALGRFRKAVLMSTITIDQSSGNVYADMGMADAQEMLVKAKLASKIGDIIKQQNLTQQHAAQLLAMPQPKVSLLLRGQFRGISEAKMLECLARLGRDIDIVVKPARRRAVAGAAGQVNVVFA